MSGDVQPRKRKDKRKKKEGTSLGNIHEIPTPKFKGRSFEEDSEPTPVIGSIDPGEKIHVHNDHGIGGNICVKIIFFCLLGALVAAIGIIFLHSRGSTDVDLPSVEDSRFADYFTGWLDDATDDHGHDENELAHGDDDGHDEEDDEHGGGEEEEEHSAEEAPEKSEEEEHGEDTAEEGSPEADDNEEENADDDEEEDEDDDEKGVHEDEDHDEPKFKVVHRFKNFFNQRKKQRISEKSEESGVRQGRKVIRVEDDDNEEQQEVVVKRNDLRKNWKEDEVKESVTWKRRERGDEVFTKRRRKKVEAVDEEEESVEDSYEEADEEEETDIELEDEEEEMSGGVKEESDEGKEIDTDDDHEADEGKEESKEDVNEVDDEEGEENENEEDVEESDEDVEENVHKLEESDEDVKEAGDGEGEDEEESDEDAKDSDEDDNDKEESDQGVPETDGDDDSPEDEEGISSEVGLGLDEIDESEEALKEEEKFLQAEETSSREEETIVNDKEVEEVESKILDIEAKLNQILREKRKKVEQSKLELEEIEMGAPVEETREEEDDTDDEGEAEEEEEEEEAYSHGVAVKVIVGIALIVVAHLVLIKKWNSLGSLPPDEKTQSNEAREVKGEDDGGDETEPVISRRQTLVPEATDLNEYFADEGDEETGEEEEEEEDVEEDDEEEEYSEEEEEILVEDDRKYTVDYPNRLSNLSRDEEMYTEEEEDEEELEDEGEEEEEEEEEEEDVEEADYGWKRLEPARTEVEEEVEAPPIPPPRRSHTASGERRGGPQGIDDFAQINEAFEELWDGYDFAEQVEDQPPSGEREQVEEEEEEEEEKAQVKSEDYIYKEEFRFAEDQLDNNPTASLKKYELILSRNPESVRALTGRAKALDKIAEKERSNQYLREAINAYRILLTKHGKALADGEFLLLSERCIDRMRFRGFFKSAIEIHKGLIERLPDNPKYRNDLAVTYLFLNEVESARSVLTETLKIWPKNGFALVHYGFVLKTADNNHAEAVEYLMAGIRSREPGVIDGRFFFHLGDALNRLGRGKEAMEWYDRGVKEGLFLSKYQRSLYNVNRLKGQPWWTHEETTYQDFFRKLEGNWEKIRSEGLTLLNSKGVNLFKEEAENLKDTGDWRQLDLYFRGTRHSNCQRAPFTCSLVAAFAPASSCTRGQVKFSVMLPSTHVWPHCGPTNCRLRSHLGLVVPKNTYIRVAEETRSWEEGKVIVFDDSFEHEVWHNGTGARLVLIVDVWHPELTAKERTLLSPI